MIFAAVRAVTSWIGYSLSHAACVANRAVDRVKCAGKDLWAGEIAVNGEPRCAAVFKRSAPGRATDSRSVEGRKHDAYMHAARHARQREEEKLC